MANFTKNITFLDTQRRKVELIVNQVEGNGEETVNGLSKLNNNIDGIISDLTEVDHLIEAIKNKQIGSNMNKF